jgi:hypothetical protein
VTERASEAIARTGSIKRISKTLEKVNAEIIGGLLHMALEDNYSRQECVATHRSDCGAAVKSPTSGYSSK